MTSILIQASKDLNTSDILFKKNILNSLVDEISSKAFDMNTENSRMLEKIILSLDINFLSPFWSFIEAKLYDFYKDPHWSHILQTLIKKIVPCEKNIPLLTTLVNSIQQEFYTHPNASHIIITLLSKLSGLEMDHRNIEYSKYSAMYKKSFALKEVNVPNTTENIVYNQCIKLCFQIITEFLQYVSIKEYYSNQHLGTIVESCILVCYKSLSNPLINESNLSKLIKILKRILKDWKTNFVETKKITKNDGKTIINYTCKDPDTVYTNTYGSHITQILVENCVVNTDATMLNRKKANIRIIGKMPKIIAKMFMAENITDFVINPTANYVFQSFLIHVAVQPKLISPKKFNSLSQQLMSALNAIYDNGNFGVLVAYIQCCIRRCHSPQNKENESLQHLEKFLIALDELTMSKWCCDRCSNPTFFLRLLYMNNEGFRNKHFKRGSKLIKNKKLRMELGPLSDDTPNEHKPHSITYHGSRILQTALDIGNNQNDSLSAKTKLTADKTSFNTTVQLRSLIKKLIWDPFCQELASDKNIGKKPYNEQIIYQLCTSDKGSHIIDILFKTFNDNSQLLSMDEQISFIENYIQPILLHVAVDKYGSRIFDHIWDLYGKVKQSNPSTNLRLQLINPLLPHLSAMRNSFFGNLLCQKYELTKVKNNPQDWIRRISMQTI